MPPDMQPECATGEHIVCLIFGIRRRRFHVSPPNGGIGAGPYAYDSHTPAEDMHVSTWDGYWDSEHRHLAEHVARAEPSHLRTVDGDGNLALKDEVHRLGEEALLEDVGARFPLRDRGIQRTVEDLVDQSLLNLGLRGDHIGRQPLMPGPV